MAIWINFQFTYSTASLIRHYHIPNWEPANFRRLDNEFIHQIGEEVVEVIQVWKLFKLSVKVSGRISLPFKSNVIECVCRVSNLTTYSFLSP